MTTWANLLRAQVDAMVADIEENLWVKPSPIHELMIEREKTSNLLWGTQTNKWATLDTLKKWSNE